MANLKSGRVNAPINPRLLNERDAANYIARSRSYLAHARCYGVTEGQAEPPPFRTIGRSVLYEISDLNNWVDALPKAISLAEFKNEQKGK